MNENRTNLEVIAPTVEEAIARGLADLNLPEEEVDIEILDTGTRGLFGLGTRQARVRISIKLAGKEEADSLTKAAGDSYDELSAANQGEALSVEAHENPPSVDIEEELTVELPIAAGATPDWQEGKEDERIQLDIAQQVVEELVDKMQVHASVSASFGEPDEPNQRTPLIINIQGKDLSILIGPHAETLNSLQYIAGLIIGKQLGHSLPLVVDVEGYRQRRAREVRLLARRMAEQAARTGRRQYLEPMPANERRLVHIELRDHAEVTTESIGEEPRRKVTIVPKQ